MQQYVELRKQWSWEIFEASTIQPPKRKLWDDCLVRKQKCQVTNMQIWLAVYSALRNRNTKPSSLKLSSVLKRCLFVIVNNYWPSSFPESNLERITWQKTPCKPYIKVRDTGFTPLWHQDDEILSDKLSWQLKDKVFDNLPGEDFGMKLKVKSLYVYNKMCWNYNSLHCSEMEGLVQNANKVAGWKKLHHSHLFYFPILQQQRNGSKPRYFYVSKWSEKSTGAIKCLKFSHFLKGIPLWNKNMV